LTSDFVRIQAPPPARRRRHVMIKSKPEVKKTTVKVIGREPARRGLSGCIWMQEYRTLPGAGEDTPAVRIRGEEAAPADEDGADVRDRVHRA
jgi:hypothetical protein